MTCQPAGRQEQPDAGAVSVEMAVFVVPVMVLLTMFVVVCARVASASISVDAASAAGARAAAAAPSAGAASGAAREAVAASSDLGRTCTASVDTGAFRPGGQVTVRVECTVSLADLGVPGLTATRVLRGSATEPIDLYRAVP